MNLESLKQNEVSQKEKKTNILTHIYMESRKMVLMVLSAGQNRDMDVQNGLVNAVREKEHEIN